MRWIPGGARFNTSCESRSDAAAAGSSWLTRRRGVTSTSPRRPAPGLCGSAGGDSERERVRWMPGGARFNTSCETRSDAAAAGSSLLTRRVTSTSPRRSHSPRAAPPASAMLAMLASIASGGDADVLDERTKFVRRCMIEVQYSI